jgi:hypothetical protein
MTTGVQVFLMAFGAILALIGVVVFFLLAWFKETTGQDHQNAIKILQAEFRFSNPALVIFAGGLILMIAPIVLGQTTQANPPLTPTPSVGSITPVPPDTPSSDSGQIRVEGPTPTLVTPTQEPTPTAIPEPPTPTPTPTTEPPTPTPTATPMPLPDPTGRWRSQTGFLEFRRLGVNEFAYQDFNNFGGLVGQGTATQDEDTLYISGEESGFDGFGNPYYIIYTGEMRLDGNVMEGDLYDTFGNYLSSVFFTRAPGGAGQ